MIDPSVFKYFNSEIGIRRYGGHYDFEIEKIECDLLLEIGVGSRFSVKSNGYMVGIDIAKELLRQGRIISSFGSLICADACFLPFRKNIFQRVYSKFLLHHLIGRTPKTTQNNIKLVLKELARVLKTRGNIFIDEWCVHSSLETMILFYITKMLDHWGVGLNIIYLEPHVVIYFLTINKLKHLLEIAKLKGNCRIINSWKWHKFPVLLWMKSCATLI